MTRHTNLTPKHLEAILGATPDELSNGELCALTLTIHAAYMEKASEISSNLIAAIVTHALSQGLGYNEISQLFSAAALSYQDPRTSQVEH